MTCPFCNLKSRIIIENDTAHMFLSNPRKIRGHVLVAPKRHITQPWKLTNTEFSDIFSLAVHAQKQLSKSIAKGSDVIQHYRPFMQEGRIKINHIHYHVIPRDFNDLIYRRVEKHERSSHYKKLDNSERFEITDILLGA